MSDQKNSTDTIKDTTKKNINWNTVLAAIPILSSILYAIARFIQYWVEISYLNFWDIPSEFMHVSDKSFVYNLATIICIAIISMLISYSIYQILLIIKKSKKHKFIKSLQFAFLIVGVWFSLFVIITLLFCLYLMRVTDAGTFSTALNIVVHEKIVMVPCVFLSAIFTVVLFCLGSTVSPKAVKTNSKTLNDTKKIKNSKNNKRIKKVKRVKKANTKSIKERRTIAIFIIGLLFIVSIISYGFYLYTFLLQLYKDTTEFEIIENKYVVLYKDTENLVAKQCLIDDNTIYIDNDTYQLLDTTGAKIQTIRLTKNGEESVFKRLTSEEFQELTETNSQEDTPS